MLLRTDWDELDASARAVIEARTGPVLAARTANEGKNSHVAALLETTTGTVFVKGLRMDHRGVVTQQREATVNPYVRPISPALLWHVEDAGWSLLGFEPATGCHADYSPDSPDLPKVLDTMGRLAHLRCPELPPLKKAEQRWAEHIDNPDDLALLAGDSLLHTDWAPDNTLLEGPSARLIDWAWPTRGAAFIDPACLIVRLILAGHTPPDAEAVVSRLPAWHTAPSRSIDVFASALCRMWADIAAADPTPWKHQAHAAADAWARHRNMT